ncbi:MAG: hypothetical protein IJ719_09360 [Clostridia bacterium]|nr:hypothetical protein [Clostridia bacterium]
MKCPYCRNELSGDSDHCPNCGRSIVVKIKKEEDYIGPLGTSRPILTWGILAIGLGCIPITCVLGVVFGLIGLHKANNYAKFTGTLLGPARAGKILSILGISMGVIVTVLTVIALSQHFSMRDIMAFILPQMRSSL